MNQENILDNLVNKNALSIKEFITDYEDLKIQDEKVLTLVSANDAYQLIRKAEREHLSESFNILSENSKQKLEI